MKKLSARSLALCGLFAALIALCSWITLPTAVPFTMQTFGIFCTLLLLGGRLGTISIAVYVLVGAVGVPVFAGFQGGMGVILSPLGGYVCGFLAMAVIYRLLTAKKETTAARGAALVAGLAACYLMGTLWYMFVSETDFIGSAAVCVLPFILPDTVKMLLAFVVWKRTRYLVRNCLSPQ